MINSKWWGLRSSAERGREWGVGVVEMLFPSQMSLAQASAALSKLFLKSRSLVGLKNAAASIAVLMGAGEMQH